MNSKTPWIPWALVAVIGTAFAVALPVALRTPAVVEKKIQISVEVVRTVTNSFFFTNTIAVTNEIPVTVEKIVEVPADIPLPYLAAGMFLTNYAAADLFTEPHDSLKGISKLKVAVLLKSAVSRAISEESARAKFELKLRQLGVPISEDSFYRVTLSVDGMWDRERSVTLTYTINTALWEMQTIVRDDAFHRGPVTTWENGMYGFAGREVAPDALAKGIEEQAEMFAN